ncbi:MAG: gamma-glutamylcyclotransferase [Pseudomonadota bacterium]
MSDPYAHHPELRGKIRPAAENFLRNTPIEELDQMAQDMGAPSGWRLPDDVREAERKALLKGRAGQDLWVFAYGSLMWDPGLFYTQVRRAFLPGYARRFTMIENIGGRGTRDQPGTMATLDHGPGCEGLVFCIAADQVEVETFVLWQRERVAEGYLSVFLPAEVEGGTVQALCFVSDHNAEMIQPDLTREQIVHHMATGEGILGTSLDYVRNLKTQLDLLGISDAHLSGLLDEAETLSARLKGG